MPPGTPPPVKSDWPPRSPRRAASSRIRWRPSSEIERWRRLGRSGPGYIASTGPTVTYVPSDVTSTTSGMANRSSGGIAWVVVARSQAADESTVGPGSTGGAAGTADGDPTPHAAATKEIATIDRRRMGRRIGRSSCSGDAPGT